MSETTATDTSAPAQTTPGQPDDLATLLTRREHARPNRATWALLALMLVAAGFVGGALAFRTWGPASPSAPAGLPDFAALAAAGGPPGGTGAAAPGQASPVDSQTTGTVTLVSKGKLYLTASDGTTVVVTVPADAPITVATPVDLSSLTAGMTVVVHGETADDGSILATSVSSEAEPVTDNPAESTTLGGD